MGFYSGFMGVSIVFEWDFHGILMEKLEEKRRNRENFLDFYGYHGSLLFLFGWWFGTWFIFPCI